MKSAITRRFLQPLLRNRTFYPNRGVIFASTITLGPGSNPVYTKGDVVHSDIPYRSAPAILERPTDTQVETADYVRALSRRRVAIPEYFPDVTENMIFTDEDGVDWNILGAEPDGNHITMRLSVEKRNPDANPI